MVHCIQLFKFQRGAADAQAFPQNRTAGCIHKIFCMHRNFAEMWMPD